MKAGHLETESSILYLLISPLGLYYTDKTYVLSLLLISYIYLLFIFY